MIILKATTETIVITTSTSSAIKCNVSYADITTTTFSPAGSGTNISSATTTTIVSAPGASTQRQIKYITITNTGSSNNVVTVYKDISASQYKITPAVTLVPNSTLSFIQSYGWSYDKGMHVAEGADTNIQYNSSGALAGASDLTWDNSLKTLTLGGTNTSVNLKGISSEPPPPSANNLTVYSKAIAGRMQLKVIGPSGIDTPLQVDIKQNGLNGILCDAGILGFTGAATGTQAAVLPTTTNIYTQMRRTTYANVVTTQNQQVGQRTSTHFRQFGFNFVCRLGFDSIKTGMRAFVGLAATAASAVTADPSAALNTIGFGFDLADTAWTFMTNDGAGTAQKIAIPGQGVLATNNVGFDAYIFCKPNDGTVYYRFDVVDTGVTVLCDTFTTSKLPAASTSLQAVCAMSNGTANIVAGDAKLGINKLLVETDR